MARDFVLFLPLILVIAGSLKKDSYQPEPGAFSEQVWRYADVVLVVVLLTVTGFLGVPSPLKDQLGTVGASAMALTAQAVLILGVIYGVLRWKYGLPFAALGFGRCDFLHHLVWSLKIVFATLTGVGLLASVVVVAPAFVSGAKMFAGPQWPWAPGQTASRGLPVGVSTLLFYVNLVIVMPLMEEVLFRGFVHTPFLRKFGHKGGAIFASALWAIGHYPKPGRMIVAVMAGLIYMYVYHRRQSLIPSLTFHSASNGLATVMVGLLHVMDPKILVLTVTVTAAILWGLCSVIAGRRQRGGRCGWPPES